MIDLKKYEVWFVTGSQHLYGADTLREVYEHAQQVAQFLAESSEVPVRVVCKPVLTTPDAILEICQAANSEPNCIGLITWMHTFSPAKMWIAGLSVLRKPFLHLHTQFNREIPWSTIDMDFMNTNQSAHGGREFGFICSRMRLARKVVVGHWQEERVQREIGIWTRVAAARADAHSAKFARIGDNMREVAVTDGDKVAAQLQLGYSVNGYGVGDVVKHVDEVAESYVDQLCREYDETYEMSAELRGERRESLRDAARIELGLRAFLTEGDFVGFTDTFENLHGLKQLPGLPVQRLMNDGYGFGAEGDWKAAAMTRAAKVMAAGLKGGTSFMEDYTYHLTGDDATCLGSHMLEICPSIAQGKPSCEIHPLGIGGKEDPVRLVFDTPPGPAVNATLVDMGNRFRMVINEVEVITPLQKLEKLPVARALWKPLPDLNVAAAAWILAGGSHHPTFSQALTTQHFEDFAEMNGVELLVIDAETRIRDFKNSIRCNDASGAYS
ncbi:L-arabinose isomerase [Bythopirellula polymerisocia]|uniref:L-arabinose isomerase n=1 Tax=Bythopirellula polymerisocia TaxID=2528003 RepID=A0A5C6CXV5_9BACT|nr:L-arabinose isomerase [Bythopirellula polymerisocia]TWU29380.1 L-arabinose isomerase [Bythopirellula polymerisocia]